MVTGPGDEIAAGAQGRGRLRASHADRAQVVEILKVAFVRGQLTKDELDVRLGLAITARTYAALAAVTADLPPGPIPVRPIPARPRPSGRAQNRPDTRTEIRTGVQVVMVTTVLAALLWIFAVATGNGPAFIAASGTTATAIAASAMTGSRALGSWLDKRSGHQLPPVPRTTRQTR